jgi:hypothetical protein
MKILMTQQQLKTPTERMPMATLWNLNKTADLDIATLMMPKKTGLL